MAKTAKQIAEELNVDKQRVYRYIKRNNIKEAYQEKGAMFYDEMAELCIKQGFSAKEQRQESTSKASSVDMVEVVVKQLYTLQQQLEAKDRQIAELNERLAESQKLLDQQQQLNAMSGQQLLQTSPEQSSRQSWWQRLFRKTDE